MEIRGGPRRSFILALPRLLHRAGLAAVFAKPVLIADDEPMIIEIVRAALGRLGFQDGNEAAGGHAALD